MFLNIYLLCDESQKNLQTETTIRVRWTDASLVPIKSDLVGMGSNRQFEIVEIYSFEPTNKSAGIDRIYLCFVQIPGSSIPRSEWDCWKWKDRYPDESLSFQFEGVGFPEISCSFNCTGVSPAIGSRLYGGVPTGVGSKMSPVPTQWVIQASESFRPQADPPPYTEIKIDYCKAVPITQKKTLVA